MTRQEKILNKMLPGWYYHTWDLIGIHYEAPRLLRYLVKGGKVKTKLDGKYKLFKKI